MARVASRGGRDGRRRAAATAGTRPVGRAFGHLVAAVVAAAVWAYLVRTAIELGRDARDDPSAMAWGVAVLVTLAAAVFLLLVFVLVGRMRDAWAGRRVRVRVRGKHR